MDDRSIATIAIGQHALVTWNQALEIGLTPRAIQRRLELGRWLQVHQGVYRVAGAPETYAQRLLAARLAVGMEAVVSHRAAAVLHGLLTYREPPVEITTTRSRSPELHNVVIHRLADLDRQSIVVVDGIACTTPSRTLVDLGAVCRLNTVEAAFDRAVGRRLATPREVRRSMLAVARQGRRGVGTIRQLLVDRMDDKPAGVLEARMTSLLRGAALPPALPEHVVRDEHGEFIAVVDFAYPERKLAIEVDGYEAHMGFRAFRRERSRDRALRAIDWEPLHFVWAEVDRREPHVAREIRDHYRQRLVRDFGFSAR